MDTTIRYYPRKVVTGRSVRKLLEPVFFGNYFYGCCAIALSLEATLQQGYRVNSLGYYFLVFISTVLFYSYPYIRRGSGASANPRTNWYARHFTAMWWNQVLITLVLCLALLYFLAQYGKIAWNIPAGQWLLLLIFPAVAALYYGINSPWLKNHNLRNIGWLKPFVIGFSWAGLVTIYPALLDAIIHQQEYHLSPVTGLLFLKNCMFIAVLCILFDIKDYAADHLGKLRTFVVRLGLRKTIFYLVFPLSLLGIGSFIYYATTHQFHPVKILLNLIPFILLLIAAWSLRKRRSILYYLVIIDGLMLVKAICGTVAILYF